jgi:hypothetical protein
MRDLCIVVSFGINTHRNSLNRGSHSAVVIRYAPRAEVSHVIVLKDGVVAEQGSYVFSLSFCFSFAHTHIHMPTRMFHFGASGDQCEDFFTFLAFFLSLG